MPRVPVDLAAVEQSDVAARFAAMCGVGKPKPVRTGPRSWEKLKQQAPLIVKEGRWEDFKPRHLVALWAWLHEKLYGVDPSAEIEGKLGLGAIAAAKRLIDVEFGGDVGAAVDFINWTWRRERGREEWRSQNGVTGGRITWRVQFAKSGILTEFRVARNRARAGRTK